MAVRQGMRQIIGRFPDMEGFGEVAHGLELLEMILVANSEGIRPRLPGTD